MKSKNNIDPKLKTIGKFISIFILVVAGIFLFFQISNAIADTADKNKFLVLEEQIQTLYEKISDNAIAGDEWTHSQACSKNYNGPFPTGSYSCVAVVYTERYFNESDISTFLNDQKHYRDLIKDSGILQAVSESDTATEYLEPKSNVECKYDAYYSDNESVDINKDIYAYTSISCSEYTVRQSWYQEKRTTNDILLKNNY